MNNKGDDEMLKEALFLGSVFCCAVGNYPVSAAVLPVEIQDCVFDAVCSNPVLVQQEPTFSAYTYSDGGTDKFLFEYSLWPSSNESTNFGMMQLSGAAWLSANAEYDLIQESHFFTLYLDGVTPTPTNLWLGDSDGLDVGLSMPTADLLAGSSSFRLGLDAGLGIVFEGDLVTHGDQGPMLNGHSFVPCLAAFCEVGAELNLLYMQYLPSGSIAELIVNPTDPRGGILYSQYSQWEQPDPSSFVSQSYEVIPIPAAAWLFGSALGLLGWVRQKAT